MNEPDYAVWYRTERKIVGRFAWQNAMSRAYCGLKFMEGGFKPVQGTVLIRPKESRHD